MKATNGRQTGIIKGGALLAVVVVLLVLALELFVLNGQDPVLLIVTGAIAVIAMLRLWWSLNNVN